MRIQSLVLPCLIFQTLLTPVHGQTLESQTPQYVMNTAPLETGFRLKVNALWVNLNTSVWDPQKRTTVDGLVRDDFVLREDGVPQTVSDCVASETPFHLLILLDISASTTSFIDLLRQAVVRFSEQLRPGDRVAVMAFNSRAIMVQPFTTDRGAIRRALKSIKPDGSTAFYDALLLSLRVLQDVRGRKAVVVFSDGADNRMVAPGDGSQASFSELRRKIRETDALIYTIFLTTERDRGDTIVERASEQMLIIARDTGARTYRLARAADLSRTYSEIVRDLRNIYTLKYTPADTQALGWRSLAVQVKGRYDLVIRSRTGYSLQ